MDKTDVIREFLKWSRDRHFHMYVYLGDEIGLHPQDHESENRMIYEFLEKYTKKDDEYEFLRQVIKDIDEKWLDKLTVKDVHKAKDILESMVAKVDTVHHR